MGEQTGVWYCSICARVVTRSTDGLTGRLGWCTHGPDEDGKPRSTKLVPVVTTEAEAHELVEHRLDRQALLRALSKAHTAEGRATLTPREGRVLTAYEDRRRAGQHVSPLREPTTE